MSLKYSVSPSYAGIQTHALVTEGEVYENQSAVPVIGNKDYDKDSEYEKIRVDLYKDILKKMMDFGKEGID